jgi:hypothetical protein
MLTYVRERVIVHGGKWNGDIWKYCANSCLLIAEKSWSGWLCDLRCRSETTGLLGLQVQILLRAWMFVFWVCCELCWWRPLQLDDHLVRGAPLFVCMPVCDLTTSLRQPRPDLGCRATKKILIRNQDMFWVFVNYGQDFLNPIQMLKLS